MCDIDRISLSNVVLELKIKYAEFFNGKTGAFVKDVPCSRGSVSVCYSSRHTSLFQIVAVNCSTACKCISQIAIDKQAVSVN